MVTIPEFVRRARARWAEPGRPRPERIVQPAAGQESVWDYPRPPRVEAVAARVRIELGGAVLVDTTRALRVLETSHPPNYYVPPQDVDRALLRPHRGSSLCEWKGHAQYWTIAAGGAEAPGAGWSYPHPFDDFKRLRDHFSFYCAPMDACWVGNERAKPQPGGFYGGWITSGIVGPFKGEPGSAGVVVAPGRPMITGRASSQIGPPIRRPGGTGAPARLATIDAMEAAKPKWIDELGVQPGDHVLAVITDEEDISLLPPYAADGLEKGDICNVMARKREQGRMRSFLSSSGLDVDHHESAHRLSFADPVELGLNEDGDFDARRLIDNLTGFVEGLKKNGVRHLRSMGSMSWLPGTAAPEDGVYLCAKINEVFKDNPISGLCIWDSRQFGGDIIVQAMRTHPKMWIKGEVIINPLYKQPAEVLAELGRA